jgi:hypothetical protein
MNLRKSADKSGLPFICREMPAIEKQLSCPEEIISADFTDVAEK